MAEAGGQSPTADAFTAADALGCCASSLHGGSGALQRPTFPPNAAAGNDAIAAGILPDIKLLETLSSCSLGSAMASIPPLSRLESSLRVSSLSSQPSDKH